MNRMSRRENNNGQRETFVRSDNDVDNTNRIVDRNNNNATAFVQNSGNSTVNVRINVEAEIED